MLKIITCLIGILIFTSPVIAQKDISEAQIFLSKVKLIDDSRLVTRQIQLNAEKRGSPLIDYDGYVKLTNEVQSYRMQRLIKITDFQTRAANPDVLLLDARSAQAFADGHIEGALNLPLPDFNAASLAKLIGANTNREILIYCNNNFINDVQPIPAKMISLALNIQTFINLYGYGYRNVYELGEAMDMHEPKVKWIGSKTSAMPAKYD